MDSFRIAQYIGFGSVRLRLYSSSILMIADNRYYVYIIDCAVLVEREYGVINLILLCKVGAYRRSLVNISRIRRSLVNILRFYCSIRSSFCSATNLLKIGLWYYFADELYRKLADRSADEQQYQCTSFSYLFPYLDQWASINLRQSYSMYIEMFQAKCYATRRIYIHRI